MTTTTFMMTIATTMGREGERRIVDDPTGEGATVPLRRTTQQSHDDGDDRGGNGHNHRRHRRNGTSDGRENNNDFGLGTRGGGGPPTTPARAAVDHHSRDRHRRHSSDGGAPPLPAMEGAGMGTGTTVVVTTWRDAGATLRQWASSGRCIRGRGSTSWTRTTTLPSGIGFRRSK